MSGEKEMQTGRGTDIFLWTYLTPSYTNAASAPCSAPD